MNDLKLFGMRIKKLRMSKKLSQEQLAGKVDISAKYMSRIEMGQHFPSFDVIAKLGNALNVEVKDIFDFSLEVKSAKELRGSIRKLIIDMDEDNLKLAVKIIKLLSM